MDNGSSLGSVAGERRAVRLLHDPALVLALRACVALLFGSAALHKWRDLPSFRSAISDYNLLPKWGPAVAAPIVAAAETSLAVMVMLAATAAVAAIAAAGLLCLYAFAIGINLRRGRVHIDCGCSAWGHTRRLSAGLVWRNCLLVCFVLAAAVPSADRLLTWLDAVTVIAAVATAALLYRALDVLVPLFAWPLFAEAPDA